VAAKTCSHVENTLKKANTGRKCMRHPFGTLLSQAAQVIEICPREFGGFRSSCRRPYQNENTVLESDESDVIRCCALDSRRSTLCGNPNIAALRTATAFVTRAI
jgi:hypothetical protein